MSIDHDHTAVAVEALTHRYPSARPRRSSRSAPAPATPTRPALDGVSFTVPSGEVFGVLGPNGSGKSTLFAILGTLLRPTSGSAKIFGDDVVAWPRRVRRNLGVVFQAPSLDAKLTARENLLHGGHLYGLSGADLDRRIDELLTEFSLHSRCDEYVERFSGGMRRRVELAKALLHQPRLLLLDEPSTGLDPGARADLWRLLDDLAHRRGVTIALTTHLMEEAQHCDRLAILDAGRLVALDSPANLKRKIGGDVILIEPILDPAQQRTTIRSHMLARMIHDKFGPWPPDGEPTVVENRVRLERADGPAFIPQLAAAFPDHIRSLTVGQPTLEDVFLHLTGHTLD